MKVECQPPSQNFVSDNDTFSINVVNHLKKTVVKDEKSQVQEEFVKNEFIAQENSTNEDPQNNTSPLNVKRSLFQEISCNEDNQ